MPIVIFMFATSKPAARALSFCFLFASWLSLSGCATSKELPEPLIPNSVDISLDANTQVVPHIVLLHGMYRSEVAMRPVAAFLKERGYKVTNISYPSTQYPIETLVQDHLAPKLEELKLSHHGPVHFVTHSMGGILVRYYLKHHDLPNLGKVVMIAPPNKGTPLAGLFADSDWVNEKSGPAREQLLPDDDSWVNQLGPIDFEVGIIAGNHNKNIVTANMIPGEDDGVVSVASTQLQNMKDFIKVAKKHYRLRSSLAVLQQTAHFLKYGRFYHDAFLNIEG